MSVWAVIGAAGYGKTHRLIEVLRESIRSEPLADGQRVLALTFMHGSRRRLEQRLRKVPDLCGRFECTTIDALAWRLRRRWRSLARLMGLPDPEPERFEAECRMAAMLLRHAIVNSWVARSFPLVVVDEAQDLTHVRLEMVSALSDSVHLLVAADEFQCLDPTLRPNPATIWLPKVCNPITLTIPHRTSCSALLDAAVAIRAGRAPISVGKLQLLVGKGVPLAAACLANAIAWSGGGSVAVITPSLKGSFVTDTVRRVQTMACGSRKSGPYRIRWEESELDERSRLVKDIALPGTCSIVTASDALASVIPTGLYRQTIDWLRRQERTTGRTAFARDEILAAIRRCVALRRHQSMHGDHGLSAMTVHQAKNREFDGVVVLWPYTVKDDVEVRRRLLYNAVTRARRWCTVIVQNEDILKAAPFA